MAGGAAKSRGVARVKGCWRREFDLLSLKLTRTVELFIKKNYLEKVEPDDENLKVAESRVFMKRSAKLGAKPWC